MQTCLRNSTCMLQTDRCFTIHLNQAPPIYSLVKLLPLPHKIFILKCIVEGCSNLLHIFQSAFFPHVSMRLPLDDLLKIVYELILKKIPENPILWNRAKNRQISWNPNHLLLFSATLMATKALCSKELFLIS